MNGHLVLWPEVEKTLNNPKYAVSHQSSLEAGIDLVLFPDLQLTILGLQTHIHWTLTWRCTGGVGCRSDCQAR